MKKFLSLVLALAMIISCVSMVSFTANAEEATDPVGIRISTRGAVEATEYYRKASGSASAALFDESDIVWDDSTATDTGDVRKTGYIYRNYKVFNDGVTNIKFQIYYQGGNRGTTTYGWDSIAGTTGDSAVTVAANASADIKIAIPVYELADGGIAVKVTSSKYTASEAVFADGTNVLSGYAPYWTISARLQFDAGCLDANDTFVLVPEDKDDPAYLITAPSDKKVKLEKAYELPSAKFGDGTLEESTKGWGTIHGGTFSAVADPADENNTVAKLAASGAYHSIFFDLGPYIFNDPDFFYAGHGKGAYKISFKYKAESLEGYTGNAQFAVTINSQNHLNASQVQTALPDATYTHDTYYIGKTITLTEDWQTYTETFTFDEDYDMLVDLRHNSVANTAKQALTYQFGIRLDGGSKAFKDAQFNYFIDDVEIEYVGTKLGVANEITTAGGDAAYPYWRNGSVGLTEAMAVDNVITIAYDVYNIGETDAEPEIQLQNGWSSVDGLTVSEFVPAKSMNTLTLKVKTDGNGNCVKEDGTVICALSALTFRFQYKVTGSRAVNTSYVLVAKNDLSAAIINAMTGKSADWTGGTAGVAKSFDYIGIELPDYVVVTPTPVPTPTPKAVSNADAENGSTNWSAPFGGTTTVIEDPDNAENHIIQHVPSGQYHSAGFNLGPYIIQDAENYYFGNGAGTYTITFKAKAEAGKGGKFNGYLNSAWHQNKDLVFNGYTLTSHTYLDGTSFTMTDKWDTYSYTVNVTEAFLENIYKCNDLGASNVYTLNMRLDGSNKAFKVDGENNFFTYYVDDVTISYAPPATPTPTPTPKPTPVGLKLTSETGHTAYTCFNGGKLAAATGFTGTKEYTYKIHNVADQAVTLQMSVQTLHSGGWHAATGSTTEVTIPADSFMIVTSTVTVTDGKVVVSGTEYDLSACWIRINQQYSAGAQEGDGIIIEAPNGDPLYNGSGNKVTKSEVYELPVYLPHELVNGDVSIGEIGDTTIEGWTTWNGGTNTIIQDPADESNKVIKFVPTGMYSTTGFKVAPVVYNNGGRYLGNGLGVYTITLRARLEDASYLEGLDAATLAKATAFDVSLCGTEIHSENGESNSYNTNSKRIQLTGDWQTFTVTIPVRDNNYNGWIAKADAANVFVRLDASSTRAFGYSGEFVPVNYLIDDVTIEYKGVSTGYLFDTGASTSYYITSGNSVFTSEDVVNNYITSTQTFYNPNDFDIEVEYCVQAAVKNSANSGNTWSGYSSAAIIQPGQKATLTVKVPVDADGKAVIANSGVLNGSQAVDLSALFMRFNVNEGKVKQNTQFVVEEEYKGIVGTKFASWNKGWIGITPDFNIVGADLEIGSTLTINYYASLGEGYEDATMNFVRNEQTTSGVEGVLVTEGEYAGLYKFAYTGINPQAMGDNIEAVLVLDDETIARLRRYSVKDYALNMYGTKGNAELDTLIADMLAYGAASQTYTGYNADALVNADITWATSEFAVPTTVRNVEGNTDADAKVYSVGMNISNVYKLYFKLQIAEGTKYTVKLNGDDVTDKVDGGVLYTDDIKATGNATVYTLELLKDGSLVTTVTYSVDSYIAAKYNSESVGAIVKAISNYGVSAYNYAN